MTMPQYVELNMEKNSAHSTFPNASPEDLSDYTTGKAPDRACGATIRASDNRDRDLFWYCTRREGHDGSHIAIDRSHKALCAKWADTFVIREEDEL